MEITVNMMRELSLGYVDPVDPDKLMEGAAEGMVSDLDPYTEFIPEDQMSNFELLTTGKYGGVGSLIRKKGDWVTIAQPYKGSPADRAGLKDGWPKASGTSATAISPKVVTRICGRPSNGCVRRAN